MTNNVLKMKEENQQNMIVDKSDVKLLRDLVLKEKVKFDEMTERLERFKSDLDFWNFKRPMSFYSKDEKYIDTHSRRVHMGWEVHKVQSQYQKHSQYLEEKIKNYESMLGIN